VGGSLIERGGHNPLEPAAWGMPVITGPHVFNFETVYRQLEEHHGLVRVSDSAGLGEAVARLFSDPDEASRLGTAASEAVEANRGALNQVVEGVLARLAPEDGNTAAGGQA
jgi:3-deoxy-D-manno-octulosonic-acid transferase